MQISGFSLKSNLKQEPFGAEWHHHSKWDMHCSGAFQTFFTSPTINNTFYIATQHSRACICRCTHLCTGIHMHIHIHFQSRSPWNNAYCFCSACWYHLLYPTLPFSFLFSKCGIIPLNWFHKPLLGHRPQVENIALDHITCLLLLWMLLVGFLDWISVSALADSQNSLLCGWAAAAFPHIFKPVQLLALPTGLK